MLIRVFHDRWPQYDRRLTDAGDGVGWEDDLDHPRTAAKLVETLGIEGLPQIDLWRTE